MTNYSNEHVSEVVQFNALPGLIRDRPITVMRRIKMFDTLFNWATLTANAIIPDINAQCDAADVKSSKVL